LDPHSKQLLRIQLAQKQLHSFLKKFKPAEFTLKEATEKTHHVNNTMGEALTNESLTDILKLLAHYEEATQYYKHTKKLFINFPDKPGILHYQIKLGEIKRYKNKYNNTQKIFETCHKTTTTNNLPEIKLQSIYKLNQYTYTTGDLLKAKELFQNTRKHAEFTKQ